MHEMSVAISIINIVKSKMQKQFGVYYPVKKIRVLAGKLSTIVPSALEFCFEAASAGTVLEGAKLDIVEIPLKVYCSDCCSEMILDEPFFFCRLCDSFNLEIISGKELDAESFEMDENAPPIPIKEDNFGNSSQREDTLKE